MKQQNFYQPILFSICLATLLLFLFSFSGRAQIITPISFGECLNGALLTTSSSVTYQTPIVQPGDVLFFRVKPSSGSLKVELFYPSGGLIDTYNSNSGFIKPIYTILPGQSGSYKIIVTNTHSFSNGFSIALEQMNEPASAVFLECDNSLTGNATCGPTVKTYRFFMQQGSRSRITIDPGGWSPEAWVCDRFGNILSHKAQLGGISPIILDTILASETACLYVFVASTDGYFNGDYSIGHTTIFGSCAGVSLQGNSGSSNICEGDTLTLNASSPLPNTTYVWSGPNGFTSTEPQIIFFNALPAQSGTYTVTANSPAACSSTASKTIIISPLPTATPSVSLDALCAGLSFTLNVTTNAASPTYSWSGPNGYSSSLKSPTINTADTSLTELRVYTVKVIDGVTGCTNTSSIAVQVNARPTATITSPVGTAVCQSTTLLLNVETNDPDAAFFWSGPGGFTSSIQNPSIPNVMLFPNQGTYNVTVTNTATGCSRTASKSITISVSPTANISGNLSICAGESTILTATGGGTYEWSDGETTASITVSPSENATYTVTVTNTTTGCTDTESKTVIVKPLPSITIMATPDNPEICSGQGQVLLSVMSPDANNPVWKWTKNGSFISNNQVILLSNPEQSGIYTASVTDGITHCSNTALTDTVNIYQTPTVEVLQVPAPPYCAGDDLTFCANSDGTNPNFIWVGPNGPFGTTLCAFVNDVNVLQSGIYSVTVTDIHGCEGNRAVNVSINPQPMASISGDFAICEGSSTVLTASGGGTYSWSTISSGASITVAPTATTTYEVTVTNNFSCTDTANATVEVSVNDLELSAVFDNGNIEASASGGQQPYSYSIFPFVPQSPSQPGLFENVPDGTYTVIVTDDSGCTASNAINKTVDPIIAWGLTIAPNPSSGIVQIWTDKPFSGRLEIALFDLNGRRIRDFWMETPTLTLDIIDVAAGFYALRISDGEKVGAVRLAVIR